MHLLIIFGILPAVEQLEAIIHNPKLPFLTLLLGGVLLIGGLFSSGIVSSLTPKPNIVYPKESLVSKDQLTQIKVDIAGAINKPGVYSLSKEARIEDLIKASQGFSPKVNQEFVSKSLNLSQKISDGQKVYIPFQGETAATITLTSSVAGVSTLGAKIGINGGTTDQLNSLPGIGPVTSQKIINARPYNSIEELLSKKVVSKSVFGKIKDLVDLN